MRKVRFSVGKGLVVVFFWTKVGLVYKFRILVFGLLLFYVKVFFLVFEVRGVVVYIV